MAFGRAGKRPGNPFLQPFTAKAAGRRIAGKADILQRLFKPHGVGLVVRGTFEMALGTKKRESRKSMHQSGWITLEGGFAARQCVVHDMSTTGAKITIDDPNTLPAKLKLAFSRDARTGRNCEVVWRRGKSVGIKFVR